MKAIAITISYHHGRFAQWLRSREWRGLTLPSPGGARVFFWGQPTPDEYAHELAHCDQIKRLGRLRWAVTILFQYARYGYYAAPLEISARKEAGQ